MTASAHARLGASLGMIRLRDRTDIRTRGVFSICLTKGAARIVFPWVADGFWSCTLEGANTVFE